MWIFIFLLLEKAFSNYLCLCWHNKKRVKVVDHYFCLLMVKQDFEYVSCMLRRIMNMALCGAGWGFFSGCMWILKRIFYVGRVGNKIKICSSYRKLFILS